MGKRTFFKVFEDNGLPFGFGHYEHDRDHGRTLCGRSTEGMEREDAPSPEMPIDCRACYAGLHTEIGLEPPVLRITPGTMMRFMPTSDAEPVKDYAGQIATVVACDDDSFHVRFADGSETTAYSEELA